MYIRSKALSVLFKLVLIGLVAYGVTVACTDYGVGGLRYFTLESNILLGCVTLYLLIARVRAPSDDDGGGRAAAYLRGVALLSISLTCVVFNVMLAPQIDEPLGFESHVLHLVVPVGFVLDWLLFARKGWFRLPDIGLWLFIPLAYLLVTLVVAAWDGFYPYPFMDASEIGYGKVALNALILLVGFGVLGIIYVAVDRLMGRRERREPD
jgi:hypothetical protein